MNAVVPGPRHPDLLGGETPMTCRIDALMAYRLEVVPAGMGRVGGAVMMLALTALKRAGLVERREGGSWLPTREGRAQAVSAPPAAPKPASPAPAKAARVAAAPATPLAPPGASRRASTWGGWPPAAP